ncbi:MAG TPA: hypothetical protein VFD95_05820 [Usitatibacter sp.]|jgi:hypothetical protein|nr:hypothetical protein [Usitatibacter sp.]
MTWQDQLDRASTEAEVVALVREFMATVSPLEAAGLPESLRPRRIADAHDVTSYAFDLVRGDVADDEGSQRSLHRLAHFLSRASVRLAEILSERRGIPSADGGRSA